MSTVTTNSEPIEQILIKIKQADEERSSLLLRHAVLEEKYKQALKHRDVIEKEMAALGTNPSKIEADLAAAREKLSVDTTEYLQGIENFRNEIEKAENLLAESK